jgi:glycerol-3-phosphate responsive antiterminator
MQQDLHFLSFLFFTAREGCGMKITKELLLDSPIIAAVKEDAELIRALESDCQVVFLLYGNIVNIDALVQRVRDKGKICIVHIDLVDGLSGREIAVDGLVKLCRPDGIISTKPFMIRRARQLGLLTIQRVFLLDSISLKNILSQMDLQNPDFIEVLPGVIPSALKEITAAAEIPVIAGGMIRTKQEVIQALAAGAAAVSTSCQSVWKL